MKFNTIPFVFELVLDASSIQYVIIRHMDGRVLDVCKSLIDAVVPVRDFMDENFLKKTIKDES